MYKTKFKELHDEFWMKENIKKLSPSQIADKLGCSRANVSLAVKRFNLFSENIIDYKKSHENPNKVFLWNKIWLENELKTKTIRQVALELGYDYSALQYAIKKQKVNFQRKNICFERKKYKNKNYKDLKRAIRNCEKYEIWRENVFKRDNFTCQICNIRGTGLNADHINSFAENYYCFLDLYKNFCPIKDKNFLFEKAKCYLPFWDINNGRTLCLKCHLKTKNFAKRIKTN